MLPHISALDEEQTSKFSSHTNKKMSSRSNSTIKLPLSSCCVPLSAPKPKRTRNFNHTTGHTLLGTFQHDSRSFQPSFYSDGSTDHDNLNSSNSSESEHPSVHKEKRNFSDSSMESYGSRRCPATTTYFNQPYPTLAESSGLAILTHTHAPTWDYHINTKVGKGEEEEEEDASFLRVIDELILEPIDIFQCELVHESIDSQNHQLLWSILDSAVPSV